MDRRHFLKLTCLNTLLCLGSQGSSFAKAEKNKQPNVVIFFLDDSGYGDYTHTGNPTISTPNITKLKQDGVSFSQFYVPAAACSASRYSLLTGRYPGRSGLGRWVLAPEEQRYIHPGEITIADGLKSKGYATGIFGKWHLGSPNDNNNNTADSLPAAHGFDTWIGTNVSHDFDNAKLMKSDPNGSDPVAGYTTIAEHLPSNPQVCESLTGLYTEAAVKFIMENRNKPFFAYIAHNMPHLGLYSGDAFKDRSRRGRLGDVMVEIDDSVGRVRKALKEAGVDKNTLIIFSSDNGPWIKFRDIQYDNHPKYGEARMDVGYAMPFRDGKGSTWEGGHRVAGIFCMPGAFEGNRTIQTPASTLDCLPTIFALCGVDIPNDRTIDGRDIRSVLMPDKQIDKPRPLKFLYNYYDNKPSAIRKGPWKLHIRIGSQTGNNYGFEASREKPLLFQIEQDIGERIDRAAERPDIVKEMLAELKVAEEQIMSEGSFWDEK
jgi:arylsulfatase A